jgi:hypothetical protein
MSFLNPVVTEMDGDASAEPTSRVYSIKYPDIFNAARSHPRPN